jgi:hypothetical protein
MAAEHCHPLGCSSEGPKILAVLGLLRFPQPADELVTKNATVKLEPNALAKRLIKRSLATNVSVIDGSLSHTLFQEGIS